MREYIDDRTQAIKYDLYFSDKQIKTGYVENGAFVPFTHNRQIDKNTGEKMLMYRIALRDAAHRSFQFQNEGLNSQPCFIQVPAASVKRKVKGLTSVYTVTTPFKDKWNLTVYAGDINAKSAWGGLKERIGLDALSQCLEYQGLEKGKEDPQVTEKVKNETMTVEQNSEKPQDHEEKVDVATLPQEKESAIDEIDQFFPKTENEKPEQAKPVQRKPEPQIAPAENNPGELVKVIELLVSQNQQMIQGVGQLANAMTQMMEQQAIVSAKLSEAVESHQETKSIFSSVKGWLKQMTSRTQQVSKDVAEVKADLESSKEVKTPIRSKRSADMTIYDQLHSIRISNQLIQTELNRMWDALAEYDSVLFLAEDYADQIIQDQTMLKQEVDEISSGLIRLQDLQAKLTDTLQGIRSTYMNNERRLE